MLTPFETYCNTRTLKFNKFKKVSTCIIFILQKPIVINHYSQINYSRINNFLRDKVFTDK